jgi:hypothetical protein
MGESSASKRKRGTEKEKEKEKDKDKDKEEKKEDKVVSLFYCYLKTLPYFLGVVISLLI